MAKVVGHVWQDSAALLLIKEGSSFQNFTVLTEFKMDKQKINRQGFYWCGIVEVVREKLGNFVVELCDSCCIVEWKQKKRQKLELLTYTASVYQWKGIGVDEDPTKNYLKT